tara:strand:- start:3540 stop:3875 length:336 start_codon:yes stop_codon:yes gene_type:complete
MNNDLYVVLLLGLAIIYLYKKNNKLFGGVSDNENVDKLRKANHGMHEHIKYLENIIRNNKMELNDIHTKYKNKQQELDNTKINSIFAYDKNKNGVLDKNEFNEELLSKFKI